MEAILAYSKSGIQEKLYLNAECFGFKYNLKSKFECKLPFLTLFQWYIWFLIKEFDSYQFIFFSVEKIHCFVDWFCIAMIWGYEVSGFLQTP